MNQDFLKRMLNMAQGAGKIALELIDDSKPSLKVDKSVVTVADIAISKYIRHALDDLLKTEEHILIDEESERSNQYFDQKVLEAAPYAWVIDPIDGTRAFANRVPLYGISIGLLKDLKPWMGIIFLPNLHELYYCDGTDSYFVKNPFTPQEIKIKIQPLDQPITRQSFFFSMDSFFNEFDWDFHFCQMVLPACAVIDVCWPAVGRGCGCYFHANLWDLAGAWPVARSAGLELRSVTTGAVMNKVNTNLFVGEGIKTWRFKERYILSSARNFSHILKHMQPKNSVDKIKK